jgi:hypothetical protein
LIEREAAEIINRGLKPARKTLTRLAAMGTTKTANKAHLKLALDASKHITSMAGLSGTTPSTIITALIQVNEAPQQHAELNTLIQFISQQASAMITNKTDNTITDANMDTIDVAPEHTDTPHPSNDGEIIDVDEAVDNSGCQPNCENVDG